MVWWTLVLTFIAFKMGLLHEVGDAACHAVEDVHCFDSPGDGGFLGAVHGVVSALSTRERCVCMCGGTHLDFSAFAGRALRGCGGCRFPLCSETAAEPAADANELSNPMAA